MEKPLRVKNPAHRSAVRKRFVPVSYLYSPYSQKGRILLLAVAAAAAAEVGEMQE